VEGVEGMVSEQFDLLHTAQYQNHWAFATYFYFSCHCSATLKKMPRAFVNVPYI